MSNVTEQNVTFFDAIVVGAGFAGMYSIHKLQAMGLNVRGLEAGSGVGGVWYWNRYPGARCDVESLQYSYSFDPELARQWDWSERYAAQPEILSYAQHVADRYDLEKSFQFNTRVASAAFDANENRWHLETTDNEKFACQYLVMATGSLSTSQVPALPGLDDFEGPVYHTGMWPHEPVDFAGKRVAIIGTGSSGIQTISTVAKTAEMLTVFQRTPNFSVPMHNRPMDTETRDAWRQDIEAKHRALRASKAGQLFEINEKNAVEVSEAEREAEFERRWQMGSPTYLRAFADLMTDETANSYAAEFVRRKIRSIVQDPQTAEDLSPTDHPIGAKRICVDQEYFSTYNRPNVKLVNLRREPLDRIVAAGVTTSAGQYPADVLILATGYDAVTGALMKIDVRGLDGATLKDAWSAGPQTYLGLMSAGFPNLFMITGPGSPSITVNVILAIEQHVEWVAECIAYMRKQGLERIDVSNRYQEEWGDHVREAADQTLFPKANSFYMGSNIPGKPRTFLLYLGGLPEYTERCRRIAENGYEGFIFAHRNEAEAKALQSDHSMSD